MAGAAPASVSAPLGYVVAVAAVISDAAEWRALLLLLLVCAGFVVADVATIKPFTAARNVQLSVRTDIDDQALAESVVLPLAQELIINAVKHADPTTIDVFSSMLRATTSSSRSATTASAS